MEKQHSKNKRKKTSKRSQEARLYNNPAYKKILSERDLAKKELSTSKKDFKKLQESTRELLNKSSVYRTEAAFFRMSVGLNFDWNETVEQLRGIGEYHGMYDIKKPDNFEIVSEHPIKVVNKARNARIHRTKIVSKEKKE